MLFHFEGELNLNATDHPLRENNMVRPLWQLLLDFNEAKKAQQMTCDECFMVLEFYADQFASGVDPQTLNPALKQHLAHCPNCSSKFAAWIRELEGRRE